MRKLIGLTLLGFYFSGHAAHALATDSEIWSTYAKSGAESVSLGDFVGAESKYRSALDANPPKSAQPKLQVQYTLALMSQGKFAQASKELKKALSLSESISGEQSAEYGEALDLQAWMYQANGKMQDALSSLKESISVFEAKSPDSKDAADALEHMGLLQETIGLYEPAQESYAKALEIRKKLSGPNSIEAADLYESLGQIAQRRGLPAEGQKLIASALRIKESRGEAWKHFAPEPTDRIVMFHFIPGAPGCEQGIQDGTMIEKVTGNSITVEAGINQKPSDFAKTTRALVRIHNGSQYDIDVLPQPPTFIQITPTVQLLKPLNPQELASRIEKKGESKAKWIKFWGADAMTPVTSYAYTQGRGVPVYGYVSPAFGWGYNNYAWNNRASYSTGTTMTTMVPDYQAREEAYRKAAQASSQSKSDAVAIRESALGPARLPAGGSIQGSLDFELSKYKKAILRIPVGNAVFEFRFE